jgi:isoamylase
MLLAGDEFGRTQQGNNNAYCQDDDISWVDWALADGKPGRSLTGFVTRLLQMRRDLPVLRRNRFLTGGVQEPLTTRDSAWFAPSGQDLEPADWENKQTRSFALLLDGRAPASAIPAEAHDASVLILINGWHEGVPFKLPAPPNGPWELRLDTNDPEAGQDAGKRFGEYVATGRSVVVFTSSP